MSKRKKDGQLSRRDFLESSAALGLFANYTRPLGVALGALVEGFVQNAAAQTASRDTQLCNLLYVHLNGGPARWGWDLFLKPWQESLYEFNPAVTNRFAPSTTAYTDLIYQTWDYTMSDGTVLQCPELWKHNVPGVSGSVPMHSLLENFMSVRATAQPGDGHLNNRPKMARPDNADFSVCGAVNDYVFKNKLGYVLPSLALNETAAAVFKSKYNLNVPQASLNANNPLEQILSSYLSQHRESMFSTTLSRRVAMDSVIEGAAKALQGYAQSHHAPSTEGLFQMRHQADAYFREGLEHIVELYQPVFEKYNQLIISAVGIPIEGIDDLPVTNSGTNNVFGFIPRHTVLHSDLADTFRTGARISQMAETFALAEILFSYGLSKSVSQYIGMPIENIDLGDGGTPKTWNMDEHHTLSHMSILGNKTIFLAYSACLVEFKRAMQAAGKWENTVVYTASELGRINAPNSAITTSANSAHNLSTNGTLIGGNIEGPIILGNIEVGAPWNGDFNTGARVGTNGVGAYVELNGTPTLTNVHMVNTVAKVIGSPDLPVSNFPALVTVGPNGKISMANALIEKARNVG